MQGFQFQSAKLIVNEFGGMAMCAQYCQKLNIKHVLIVTDKGIVEHGLLDDIQFNLAHANIAYTIFDGVQADPSDTIIKQASSLAIQERTDGVLGIGGGSSLDCAKLVSVLACEKQPLEDMFGIDQVRIRRQALILAPTTAGTGSEVTPIAIVTTGETTKSAVVDSELLPDVAILDASLTLDLPPEVTASTGIDAMVHAIEAFTSKIKKNPLSDMLAKEALCLLSENIKECVVNGKNANARQNMLLGACYAGQAFANAPVGAVHALAYPLGGHFKIAHGLSNALVLPHVIRFNAVYAGELYDQLSPLILPSMTPSRIYISSSEALAQYFFNLSGTLGLPQKLRDLKIDENYLSVLAQDAMMQTRLLMNNPRDVSYTDALRIYQDAY